MTQQSLLLAGHNPALPRTKTGESLSLRAWRRFRRHKLAMASIIFLGVMIVAALAAPLVAGSDPLKMDPRQTMAAPSIDHPLGTDLAGRDIWARLVYGTRARWRWGWSPSRFRWRLRCYWARWPATMAVQSI